MSSVSEKVDNIPIALSELCEDTGYFNNVLRGFPEGMNSYQSNSITIYFNDEEFEQTMGRRNPPKFVYTQMEIIARGTRTAVHDEVLSLSSKILAKFGPENPDDDWLTVKGNARNTIVLQRHIQPLIKPTLLTSCLIRLQHDVRWNMQ